MNVSSVEALFEGFNQKRILIIGDVMVDAYIWGSVDRISPEAPVPVIRAKEKDFRLGGAANVALNILALGAQPIMCALVGGDSNGEKFIKRTTERGIDTSGIVVSTERPTTVKTRIIASQQHIVRVDEETDAAASDLEEAALLNKIEALLPSCDGIIFEDYDKGAITPAIIKKTVDLAKKNSIPTVVDPKKRNFLNYHGVTLFKPNLKELKEGLKIDFNVENQKELGQATNQLIERLQCGAALITLSEYGVVIKDTANSYAVKAHLREIADVSGAGDTVISIAGLCVAMGMPLQIVAELSNLGGGLVCEHVGVVPIDKEVLKKEALKLNIF